MMQQVHAAKIMHLAYSGATAYVQNLMQTYSRNARRNLTPVSYACHVFVCLSFILFINPHPESGSQFRKKSTI